MVWTIAKREFLSNVITLRFLMGFALCLLLIVASAYTITEDYAARLKTYDESVTEHVKKIRQTKIFSNLSGTIDRPPGKLSFMCAGSDRRMRSDVSISREEIPSDTAGSGNAGTLLVIFPSLDMAVIIQIILSLLVLLFAYDTISGEKERGTLAQVLSNSVPRHQILMGKYIGGMMSVIFPLLVGVLAGLIVVWFSGHIALDNGDWIRLTLAVLASLLYISVFFLLGILVSSLTNRSATSLVILLFLWVILVIIVPNAGPYAAKRMRPIQGKALVSSKEDALSAERWEKLVKYGEKLRRQGMFPEALLTYQRGRRYSHDLPYASEIDYAPKANLRWYVAGTKYLIEIDGQHMDRVWEFYREYNSELDRQVSLARFLSRVSPAWTYYNASTILAGTDVGNYRRFMDQARRYRQELIDYTRNEGGFSTPLYFTRMTMEDAPTTKEAEEMVKRLGRAGFEKKMMEYMKNVKPFDNIPIFEYAHEPISESFLRALPDLAILIIMNVILFMMAHVCFLKGRVK